MKDRHFAMVIGMMVIMAIGGLAYVSTLQNIYSLRLTHNRQPIKNLTVSLCLHYCSTNTMDFKQEGTDASGEVHIGEGVPYAGAGAETSGFIFEFIYNGTGYTIGAVEGQLVDDPL